MSHVQQFCYYSTATKHKEISKVRQMAIHITVCS